MSEPAAKRGAGARSGAPAVPRLTIDPRVLAAALLATFPGCTCSGEKSAAPIAAGDASSTSSASSSASSGAAGVNTPGAGLSAPIGAAVVAKSHGAVLVAGLDATRGAVVLQRIDTNGNAAFRRDVLDHVGWAPDAALEVFAAPDGASFVTFRGLRAGKPARLLVAVDPSGAPRGTADDTAGAACATDDGLAWVGREKGSHYAVFQRGWAEPTPRTTLSLKADDGDVLFSCGAHRVFPLVEGEGTVSLVRGGQGGVQGSHAAPTPEGRPDPGRATSLLVAQAPSGGEMHDHVEYTQGDGFGVVLPDASGTLAFRELQGDALTPWHRLHARLGEDGAVVAADADETSVFIVSTRDDGASCPEGSTRTQLAVTRTARSGAGPEVDARSPAACGPSTGPYSTGFTRGVFTVAWAERKGESDPRSAPPFVGVAYARFAGESAIEVRRAGAPADAIADAGCDDDGCYAAELLRPEGTDGMVPGPIRVVKY